LSWFMVVAVLMKWRCADSNRDYSDHQPLMLQGAPDPGQLFPGYCAIDLCLSSR
jgi:hypothetical protein